MTKFGVFFVAVAAVAASLEHRAALKTEALKAELAGPASASAGGDGSGGAPDGWIEWNASWEQPSTPAVASVFPAGSLFTTAAPVAEDDVPFKNITIDNVAYSGQIEAAKLALAVRRAAGLPMMPMYEGEHTSNTTTFGSFDTLLNGSTVSGAYTPVASPRPKPVEFTKEEEEMWEYMSGGVPSRGKKAKLRKRHERSASIDRQEHLLLMNISEEVNNATARSNLPRDVRFVWLPEVELPDYWADKGPAQVTPLPTPALGAGPFHFFWDPVAREVVEDDVQRRRAENAGNSSNNQNQLERERSWRSIAPRFVAYMKDLATDIISGNRTLLEFPRMAPMPAAHWRHVSSNGSSAQSVLIEQNSDDEKVTQKPAPTSVFVQVTKSGDVITNTNLRTRYDDDGDSDEDEPASGPQAGGAGAYRGDDSRMDTGRAYRGRSGRSDSDMGIVGWASGSQVDQTFSLRTLGFIFFLLIMYYCIICLGLILTYKTAILHPEVKFFSGLDPQHDICRAESTASILQAFNQKPKAYIRVKGKGLDYQLDLSSWLTEGPIEDHRPIEAFVRASSPFRKMTIIQQVACPVARDLEKRVLGKLEQVGVAPSSVEVTIPLKHYVNVYRNEQLANFLHNRTTRLLFALSGVGLLFFPYSWFCATTEVVTAHWRLNIDVDRFWAHVGPRIHRGGFRH